MTIKKISLFLCCLFYFSGLHGAEQQTVESAQKFLSMTLSGQKVARHLYEHTDNGPKLFAYKTGVIHTFVPWRRCRLTMTTHFAPWKDVSGHEWKGDRVEDGWDLTKLVEVKTKEQKVELYFIGMREPIVLTIASTDLAVRVAYAFSFLKDKCDGTADTGF